MGGDRERRDDVVRLVQLLVLEGGRVAGAFAHRHGLHHTDVEALTRVLVAQTRGAPLTPGALGADLGLSSGAVTAVVDRLERAGHVVRGRDATDRRRVLVHVSPEGHALVESVAGDLDDAFGTVLADLDAQDRVDILGVLARMNTALGERPRSRTP